MIWNFILGAILVATTAASYYQSKKAEKLAKKQAEEMKAVQISGHDSNRSLYAVYGKVLVGSTIVWKKLSGRRYPLSKSGFSIFSKATGSELTSTENRSAKRYLYRAVSLCSGEIEGVESVFIDNESYASARFGQGHRYHFGTAVFTGAASGLWYDNLTSTSYFDTNSWDSTKLGKGVAYAVERLYLDKDKPAYQGEPTTQYLIKGRKIYDPRLDSTVTNGSGSHRQNDNTTWAWSDNPALALLDYITNTEFGRGLDYSVVDLQSIITCANNCDVLVTIPSKPVDEGTDNPWGENAIWNPVAGVYVDAETGEPLPFYRTEQGDSETTQKRFRLNIALDGAKEVLQNVQELLNVFKANLVYVNGLYTCTMTGVANSILSITDDDIIGGLKISAGDRTQRINRATVKFKNANKQHKIDQVSWPELSSTDYTNYLSADQNEKLHKSYTIDGCTDYYQAQDTAEFIVRDSRTSLTVSGVFTSRCMALVPNDVIDITYDSASYSGKYFRVETIAVDIDGLTTKLTLREYDSSVYTWDANKGNEPIGLSFGDDELNTPPTTPTIGSITTQTVTEADGSASIKMTVPFSGVPEDADYVEVGIAIIGSNDYETNSVFGVTSGNAIFNKVEGGNTFDVRCRYIVRMIGNTLLPSGYAATSKVVGSLTGTKLGGVSDGATANAIYRQNTAPAGTSYNDGDQWFNTTNSANTAHVWDSSSQTWVSVQDSGAVAGATAVQDGDTGVDLGIDAGSVGSVQITQNSLYHGDGYFNNTNTGFYLDNNANFSLQNKLTFTSSTATLNVNGNITATSLDISNASITGTLNANKISGDVTETYSLNKYYNLTFPTSNAYGATTYDQFDFPAPSGGLSKRQVCNAVFVIKTSNTSGSIAEAKYFLDFQLKSTTNVGVEIGTVTHVNFPVSYQQIVYVSGNHTDELSRQGGVAKNNTGSGSYAVGYIMGLHYDSQNDRTYVRIGNYGVTFDHTVSANTETMFYSQSRFTSAGNWITPSAVTYIGLVFPTGTSYIHHPFIRNFGRSTVALEVRPRIQFSSNPSNSTLTIDRIEGILENKA